MTNTSKRAHTHVDPPSNPNKSKSKANTFRLAYFRLSCHVAATPQGEKEVVQVLSER